MRIWCEECDTSLFMFLGVCQQSCCIDLPGMSTTVFLGTLVEIDQKPKHTFYKPRLKFLKNKLVALDSYEYCDWKLLKYYYTWYHCS